LIHLKPPFFSKIIILNVKVNSKNNPLIGLIFADFINIVFLTKSIVYFFARKFGKKEKFAFIFSEKKFICTSNRKDSRRRKFFD